MAMWCNKNQPGPPWKPPKNPKPNDPIEPDYLL